MTTTTRKPLYQPTVEDLQEQYDISLIALEALRDDVMEPDKQTTFKTTHDCDGEKFTINWEWRCYKNSRMFAVDENLSANVKAYCFDLIIMTRNL